MILLIDNYDSFTFNLYQLLGSIDADIRVVRNDALSVDDIIESSPDRIVISPGPGYPADAGVCVDLVRALVEGGCEVPTLGVCLGHQAICEALGAQVGHARALMHGKKSICSLETDSTMFEGLPAQTEVARYHSLAVLPDTLPSCLRVTARAVDGEVMAIEHTTHPVYGLQFHPESIMTPLGMDMLRNFLK